MVLRRYLHNLNLRIFLSVSFYSAVPLAAALLDHTDLIAACVLQNLRFNGHSSDIGHTNRYRGILRKKQHLIENNLGSSLPNNARNLEFLPLRHFLLKAFDVDNGEHSGKV
ncbi:MAG: hypothetical protein Greene041662_516 [Candidatus Peregrinibacteria bacterium Greene0416_62]|nr:MAG: hypothetical protein Greene041662_516 [Candidatus Peregrinibacteria bacterium Greene0416_62]TSC98122.1 MAG: hypothetical protein Greene101449_978 [Candidatus Peregrinibacteria bacterium Greene1014_49]